MPDELLINIILTDQNNVHPHGNKVLRYKNITSFNKQQKIDLNNDVSEPLWLFKKLNKLFGISCEVSVFDLMRYFLYIRLNWQHLLKSEPYLIRSSEGFFFHPQLKFSVDIQAFVQFLNSPVCSASLCLLCCSCFLQTKSGSLVHFFLQRFLSSEKLFVEYKFLGTECWQIRPITFAVR